MRQGAAERAVELGLLPFEARGLQSRRHEARAGEDGFPQRLAAEQRPEAGRGVGRSVGRCKARPSASVNSVFVTGFGLARLTGPSRLPSTASR